jgi:hypothetical protein
MDFFPLTLGIPKPRPRREPDQLDETSPFQSARWDEAVWRESLSAPPDPVEEVLATTVLDRLMRSEPPSRPWLILGEPGAGKSRLLEHWHATWLSILAEPMLGLPVPVLVRLRELDAAALKGDPALVADHLWSRGVAARGDAARGCWAASLGGLPARLFTPIWFLDGLDELGDVLVDPALWEAIGALPGGKVLTCRTAVFQPLRRETAGRFSAEYRVLGLKPGEEQANYLAAAMQAADLDPTPAAQLARQLNDNLALRPLAASPLMLGLIAEIAEHVVLPANRAAFYGMATDEMWRQKLHDRPHLRILSDDRDRVLAALAERMGLDAIEIARASLAETGATPALEEALRRSGLLRFEDRKGRVSFPHLTFQEYHLARVWRNQSLPGVLQSHWSDPRNEEALGLLLGLWEEDGKSHDVESALLAFLQDWREKHAVDRSVLWALGRSPLRVGFRIAARGGVRLRDPLLGARTGLARQAIASSSGVSPSSLAALAADADSHVRSAAAENAATPPSSLVALAADADKFVRAFAVARNAATPPSSLAALAADADRDVRSVVAHVRWAVAGNAATPPSSLAALAADADRDVRSAVADNAATPHPSLAALAADADRDVRRAVAGNAATPPPSLAALAADADDFVRSAVAGNAATPPSSLAVLAADADSFVRIAVAGNAATPPSSLAALAADADVCWFVARNAATLLEDLLA